MSNKKFLDKLILMRFLLKLQNTNIIFNDFLVIFIVNSIFMTNFEASSQVVSPNYIYKKGGAVMGGYIHIERRNCALVFDSVELRNFHRIVRKQSNGAPHWVYCIQLVLCPFVTIVGDSWI